MEFRNAKKECKCRCCDKKIQPGDLIFHNSSHMRSGGVFIACSVCMGKIVDQFIELNTWKDE